MVTEPAPISTARAPHFAARACTQAPAVHVIVAPLSASPATVAGWPRNCVSMSGRSVSAPKKAKLTVPIAATAAGSPGRARSVPAGVRRRRLGTAAALPAARPARSAGHQRACSAISTIAVPTARSAAQRLALVVGFDAAGRAARPSTGSVSAAQMPTTGNSPKNTNRQLAWSATNPPTPGPINPGTTHAVDNSASMRGWRSGG